ncbi:hypothetical protein IEQ34_018974 [Dendrobium chrysotoxum]|uniref:Uncharacterized protein n=1 Tax=Dendrobium chrysotoxum TaxID=161865 RepID=A0AAV7G6F0_DENCH|nr:hypothetical protein IEQ34_018974 [Dendrobium chrysotoxum]
MPHNDDDPSQILVMSGLWTHAMTRFDDPILASSGNVLTTGNTFDSKSLGGIYPPLGAASCDAGNPTKNTDASTLSVHSSHALTSLSALPFAY